MATIKQKKALDNMVENGGNASKAMRDAGYSPKTAENPDKLTQSKGYMELLDELGLTDEFIANALREDIAMKPQNRVQELALAAKLRGRGKDSIDITTAGESVNPYASLSVEELRKLAGK